MVMRWTRWRRYSSLISSGVSMRPPASIFASRAASLWSWLIGWPPRVGSRGSLHQAYRLSLAAGNAPGRHDGDLGVQPEVGPQPLGHLPRERHHVRPAGVE